MRNFIGYQIFTQYAKSLEESFLSEIQHERMLAYVKGELALRLGGDRYFVIEEDQYAITQAMIESERPAFALASELWTHAEKRPEFDTAFFAFVHKIRALRLVFGGAQQRARGRFALNSIFQFVRVNYQYGFELYLTTY